MPALRWLACGFSRGPANQALQYEEIRAEWSLVFKFGAVHSPIAYSNAASKISMSTKGGSALNRPLTPIFDIRQSVGTRIPEKR